jgi:hypothetical protein
MMPLPMGRKSNGKEKVENLCRTARAQNELINTSVQFSSRLRDVGSIDRHGATIDASIHSEASPLISKPSQSVPRGGRPWERRFRPACRYGRRPRAGYRERADDQSDPAAAAPTRWHRPFAGSDNPRQK